MDSLQSFTSSSTLILENVLLAVAEGYEAGELSILQRHGILTLLPKENKDIFKLNFETGGHSLF